MSDFKDIFSTFENMMGQRTKILGNGATSYTVDTPGQINSTEPFINAGTLETNKTNCYGYCPICHSPGVSRERRPDGNDMCKNGHLYLSKLALKYGED